MLNLKYIFKSTYNYDQHPDKYQPADPFSGSHINLHWATDDEIAEVVAEVPVADPELVWLQTVPRPIAVQERRVDTVPAVAVTANIHMVQISLNPLSSMGAIWHHTIQ